MRCCSRSEKRWIGVESSDHSHLMLEEGTASVINGKIERCIAALEYQDIRNPLIARIDNLHKIKGLRCTKAMTH